MKRIETDPNELEAGQPDRSPGNRRAGKEADQQGAEQHVAAPPPREIIELIERFDRNTDAYRSSEYNETQLRLEFLDPFFDALGWDVHNRGGSAEAYKDVIHEGTIKIGGATKAPDYCFRIGGTRKFFVEAKKPAVNIKEDASPAYQLRRYAWSAKLPLSILTDFEEFAVYDCRIKPNATDNPAIGRIRFFNYREYPDRWQEITSIFSPDAVRKGLFDIFVETTRVKKGTAEVDAAFLTDIESWRQELARNLALRNPQLTQRELNFAVQRTIDRIIFLRICEDRGIEDYGRLMALTNGDRVYRRLGELFERADERYNSGLFHFHKERERVEPPDELTLALEIDDKLLKDIIGSLYYPESPYEFSVLPADILGQVYEQFLGKVIRLTAGHRAVVEDKPEVKKAGGVYYTPTYIVDYIVRQTVGKLLGEPRPFNAEAEPFTPTLSPKGRGGASSLAPSPLRGEGRGEGSARRMTPKQAAKLRVLDPACGSGSFLIGAYQYLLDWHRDQYVAASPAKHTNELYQGPTGDWRLTTAERKRILLESIYGVDIDPQAVEVTKLSLLLKVLEGESQESLERQRRLFHERALPDLGRNIKCGNSLIGPDFYDNQQMSLLDEEERYRINVFDWHAEFPEIMKAGGFDAVIGNPPYIFTRNQGIPENQKSYFGRRYAHQSIQLNTFGLFLERSLALLRQSAILGFITPNNWLTIDTFSPLRKFILENSGEIRVTNILDRVFAAADVDTCVTVLRRSEPTTLTICEMKDQAEIFTRELASSAIQAPSFIIQISFLRDTSFRAISDKIASRSQPLRSYATVSTGLKVYQTGKGKPRQTDKHKTGRVFHARTKQDQTYGRYLDGADVRRYRLEWSGEWLSYGDWIAEPRRSVPFDGERILVRQIPSTPPYLVHAVFTSGAFYNDINSMVVFDPVGQVSLKYLLGIINSRLVSLWFQKQFDKLQRRIFPQFKVKELADFPVPPINFSDVADKSRHDRMVELVEGMLALHRRLPAAKTAHDKTALERQIEATDRQIDRLVYELYGLTEEEIAIVEQATEAKS